MATTPRHKNGRTSGGPTADRPASGRPTVAAALPEFHTADEFMALSDADKATVVAYFEHDLDVMRTSKALHLHYNSLRYRLGRVEQILGRPLKDPATIASLYIALTACEHRPCRS